MLALSSASAEEIRIVAFNILRGFLPVGELPTIASLMDSVEPASVWSPEEVSADDADYFLSHLGSV